MTAYRILRTHRPSLVSAPTGVRAIPSGPAVVLRMEPLRVSILRASIRIAGER